MTVDDASIEAFALLGPNAFVELNDEHTKDHRVGLEENERRQILGHGRTWEEALTDVRSALADQWQRSRAALPASAPCPESE